MGVGGGVAGWGVGGRGGGLDAGCLVGWACAEWVVVEGAEDHLMLFLVPSFVVLVVVVVLVLVAVPHPKLSTHTGLDWIVNQYL